jgi:hypothetical protein
MWSNRTSIFSVARSLAHWRGESGGIDRSSEHTMQVDRIVCHPTPVTVVGAPTPSAVGRSSEMAQSAMSSCRNRLNTISLPAVPVTEPERQAAPTNLRGVKERSLSPNLHRRGATASSPRLPWPFIWQAIGPESTG